MNGCPAKPEVKELLRQWIFKNARRPIDGELRDDTPILEQRVISSLQVMELILFVERTSGRAVRAAQLRPSAFRSIEDIYHTFFEEASHEQRAM